MAERVRARRLTDQEGQRLQQIVRRGKHGSIRVRRALIIMASASGTIPLAEIISAIPQFMAIAATGDLPIELDEVPLADVESAWQRSSGGRRTVLRP